MKSMKHLQYNILLAICLIGGIVVASCSDDDDTPSKVKAAASGTFTDERDGEVYGWVRYGELDWMSENYRYDIGDEVNSTIYLDADENGSTNGSYTPDSQRNLARYGRLYTLEGAKAACPEGWRIPTDNDWQQLEQALGMPAFDAATNGWRGNIAPVMLSVYDQKSDLNLLLGGYYFGYAIQGGWRMMGTYGYYWSDTLDAEKEGQFYYVRKLTYARDGVCRMSMEPAGYKLSVRYVRDAQ